MLINGKLAVLDFYVPNIMASKHTKQLLTDFKEREENLP